MQARPKTPSNSKRTSLSVFERKGGEPLPASEGKQAARRASKPFHSGTRFSSGR